MPSADPEAGILGVVLLLQRLQLEIRVAIDGVEELKVSSDAGGDRGAELAQLLAIGVGAGSAGGVRARDHAGTRAASMARRSRTIRPTIWMLTTVPCSNVSSVIGSPLWQ